MVCELNALVGSLTDSPKKTSRRSVLGDNGPSFCLPQYWLPRDSSIRIEIEPRDRVGNMIADSLIPTSPPQPP